MTLVKFDKYEIFKGTAKYEKKYRPPLSKELINKFGNPPFDEPTIRRILTDSFEFFVEKFLELCRNQNSIRFYQYLLSQHEQTIAISFFFAAEKLPETVNMEYIAKYRRILKWALECACDNQLITPAEYNIDEYHEVLDEMIYLGDSILTMVTLFAEQDMIEDAVDVSFDNSGLYIFKHKHHYDEMIATIMKAYGAHYFKHVADKNAMNDLFDAIESCLGLKNEDIKHLIASIHKELEPKGGQYCGFTWEDLTANMVRIFHVDKDNSDIFFSGLTLSRNNKMPLKELAIRPQNTNRYLYRPILLWNIDGDDYALLCSNAYTESIIQLTTNSIPWGKAPKEWMANDCLRSYVNAKEEEHDKWLDDELERKMQIRGFLNYRNVTNVGGTNIIIPGVGEIDSIVINQARNKIYVIDCKHLQSKYDMVSQKNDYSNFTKGKKGGYNQQLKGKVDWINNNRAILAQHVNTTNGVTIDFSDYEIEGVFVINTPTFYMFNSEYRLYTIDVIDQIIAGELEDPSFTFIDTDEDHPKEVTISYPYFKKPIQHENGILDE